MTTSSATEPTVDTVDGLGIDEIRTDGGTQIRARIDDATVREYADDLDSLPPVAVFYDGSEYWMADGFHRLEAFRHKGRHRIPVEIHQGDRRDAVLYSVGCNAKHGLRRSDFRGAL